MTAAALSGCAHFVSQATALPSECSWLFGPSKEVLQLQDEVKELQEDKKALQEKVDSTTVWSALAANFPEGGASVLDYAGEAFEEGFPQEISYGFAIKGCIGYATKIAFKATAIATGGIFIVLQLLQHHDIVKVNHARIADVFSSVFDLNHDGKVDLDDLRVAREKYLTIVGHGVATGGGFTSGFLLSLRRG